MGRRDGVDVGGVDRDWDLAGDVPAPACLGPKMQRNTAASERSKMNGAMSRPINLLRRAAQRNGTNECGCTSTTIAMGRRDGVDVGGVDRDWDLAGDVPAPACLGPKMQRNTAASERSKMNGAMSRPINLLRRAARQRNGTEQTNVVAHQQQLTYTKSTIQTIQMRRAIVMPPRFIHTFTHNFPLHPTVSASSSASSSANAALPSVGIDHKAHACGLHPRRRTLRCVGAARAGVRCSSVLDLGPPRLHFAPRLG